MPRKRHSNGSVSVEIDTKKLNEILKALPGNRDKAVRAIAFSIEGKAKVKTPVDTGALRSSIYVRTAQGDFSSRTANSGPPLLPEKADPNLARETLPSVKPGEAVIGPSVEYGIHVEFGTSKQAAQPYLGPAVTEAARELEEHFKGVCTNG